MQRSIKETCAALRGDDTRRGIVQALGEALEVQPWVLAAWLGGSDATGRTDRWSDVDLMLVVRDECVEQAFELCRAALHAYGPVVVEVRLPMPTWHGHDQAFWQLAGAPEWCMLDMLVMRESSRSSRLLESERHGQPVVLVDRIGAVRPEPFDRAAHDAAIRARIEALRLRFALLQHLVQKAVWRGDAVEAADRYLAYTLRPLVELLRIRHCPDRYDFGLRYLRDDLPEPVWREVEALALPGSLAEVERAQRLASERFASELPLAERQFGVAPR